MKLVTTAACLAALASAAPALAADPEACQTIRMSDPGWTDITSTNALAGVVLSALGYEQEVDTLSVPVGFESTIENRSSDGARSSPRARARSMMVRARPSAFSSETSLRASPSLSLVSFSITYSKVMRRAFDTPG